MRRPELGPLNPMEDARQIARRSNPKLYFVGPMTAANSEGSARGAPAEAKVRSYLCRSQQGRSLHRYSCLSRSFAVR
jgi:hypothetical protein